MSPPLVSVIVPHYHDLVSLDACLAALERQTYPRDQFEIVVSDNNSPEGAEAVRAAIGGRARMETAMTKGAGPARNGGVAVAQGQILAFTDADCVPEPDWLARGLEALSRYDLVGGAMRVLMDDEARPSATEAFERVFAFDNRAYVMKKGFSVTANLLCRRGVFEAIGGFEVGVSEDVEWCRRASAAGYRLGYAAEAVVGHPARRDWPQLEAKWRRMAAESFHLTARQKGGRVKWLAQSLLLPLSAVTHTPRALFSPTLSNGRSRLAAVGALYRIRFWRLGENLRLLRQPPPL